MKLENTWCPAYFLVKEDGSQEWIFESSNIIKIFFDTEKNASVKLFSRATILIR